MIHLVLNHQSRKKTSSQTSVQINFFTGSCSWLSLYDRHLSRLHRALTHCFSLSFVIQDWDMLKQKWCQPESTLLEQMFIPTWASLIDARLERGETLKHICKMSNFEIYHVFGFFHIGLIHIWVLKYNKQAGSRAIVLGACARHVKGLHDILMGFYGVLIGW